MMVVVVAGQGGWVRDRHRGGGGRRRGAGESVHGVVGGVRLERVRLALRHGNVHGRQSLGPRQQGLIQAGEDVALQLRREGGRVGKGEDGGAAKCGDVVCNEKDRNNKLKYKNDSRTSLYFILFFSFVPRHFLVLYQLCRCFVCKALWGPFRFLQRALSINLIGFDRKQSPNVSSHGATHAS